jgi:hypothetical protein
LASVTFAGAPSLLVFAIMMMAWVWSGITIHSSRWTYGYCSVNHVQQRATSRPQSLSNISPFDTVPKTRSRPWVQMVTKYAPSLV